MPALWLLSELFGLLLTLGRAASSKATQQSLEKTHLKQCCSCGKDPAVEDHYLWTDRYVLMGKWACHSLSGAAERAAPAWTSRGFLRARHELLPAAPRLPARPILRRCAVRRLAGSTAARAGRC